MPRPSSARKCGPTASQPTWKTEENAWASKLRSSDRWQKLRAKILTARPLCSLCPNIADEVHHIDAKDRERFFDVSNLVPICSECHELVNSAHRRGISPEVLFPAPTRMTPEEVTCLE